MRNLCEREDITTIVGEEMGNSLVGKRVGSCVVKKQQKRVLLTIIVIEVGSAPTKETKKFKKYLL